MSEANPLLSFKGWHGERETKKGLQNLLARFSKTENYFCQKKKNNRI